ncbi:uncharacterized protein METZ01_LOCUS27728 [marine metagenome]|uniref:Uncharacterized protein n=1 Tax=marine metagenome TaxID=408172 RepID=A0A381Q7N3_9ZZZZ
MPSVESGFGQKLRIAVDAEPESMVHPVVNVDIVLDSSRLER